MQTLRRWAFIAGAALLATSAPVFAQPLNSPAIAPIWKSSATPEQLHAVSSRAKQYFQAVLGGDLKTLEAITTPDFHVFTLEGEALTAAEVIKKAKKLKFQYGNATTGGQIVAGKTNGKQVGVLITVQYAAPKLSPQGGFQNSSSFSTSHILVWNKVGSDWKLASDSIREQYDASL